MRKVVLYIAMSLDGFIASETGGVEWLSGQDAASEEMGSYESFIRTVDTVVMGYTTYHQITTELSPENWPYKGMKSYVLTHKNEESKEEVTFTDENIKLLIEKLKLDLK